MGTFFFLNKDNSLIKVTTSFGQKLLLILHKNEVDLEGAFEQSLACSTCHVILPKQLYDKLPQPIPEEEHLLDLVQGFTETSRLGYQMQVDEQFENVVISLPKVTRNFYVDIHKPNLIDLIKLFICQIQTILTHLLGRVILQNY